MSDPPTPPSHQDRSPGGVTSRQSVRLTFRYDPTGVHLSRRTVRDKPAPRGDDLSRSPRPGSLWAEVRGRDGRVHYRRDLRDAIPQEAEVFEPDGRIRGVAYAPESGVFTIVVPLEARMIELAIVAGPEARLAQSGLRLGARQRDSRRELARVPLRGD